MGEGLDIVHFAGGDERGDPCPALGAFGVAGEEGALPPKSQRPDPIIDEVAVHLGRAVPGKQGLREVPWILGDEDVGGDSPSGQTVVTAPETDRAYGDTTGRPCPAGSRSPLVQRRLDLDIPRHRITSPGLLRSRSTRRPLAGKQPSSSGQAWRARGSAASAARTLTKPQLEPGRACLYGAGVARSSLARASAYPAAPPRCHHPGHMSLGHNSKRHVSRPRPTSGQAILKKQRPANPSGIACRLPAPLKISVSMHSRQPPAGG